MPKRRRDDADDKKYDKKTAKIHDKSGRSGSCSRKIRLPGVRFTIPETSRDCSRSTIPTALVLPAAASESSSTSTESW